MTKTYDTVVAGSGAAGIIAAIVSAKNNKRTAIIEKMPSIGSKLKATGGGKCNITNTLDDISFMESFGRNGRFMQKALENFNNEDLIKFLKDIGVQTHNPDGFRVFPITHNSSTVIDALKNELIKQNVDIILSSTVTDMLTTDNKVTAIVCDQDIYYTDNIILATGGLGYPSLGTTGDGYNIVEKLGHKITPLYPAMLPVFTKESWVASCTAHTIPKATIKIDIKKHSKLKATGDLIFTKKGLRGPVILDFARELTPLIDKYTDLPILINMTKGMNENDILKFLKKQHIQEPSSTILQIVSKLLPLSVSKEIVKLSNIQEEQKFNQLEGKSKNDLIKNLAWTPFIINGHEGFDKAMVTKGGISLKQIDPNNMKSKIIEGLYFAGEIIDLDGPCGGYNLQWSFSSGFLAGQTL